MKILTGNKSVYHPRGSSAAASILNPRLFLNRDDVLILDTETTGFTGEVIELAIINTCGNTLYNQRFLPSMQVEAAATAVHGITYDALRHEPPFASEYQTIRVILEQAAIHLIYNASFDVARLDFTCKLYRLPVLPLKAQCLMKMRGGRQKLNGGHSALEDCMRALEILKDYHD